MAHRSLMVAVLLIHAGLLAWSSHCNSPTLDEPPHLAAGLSHWEFQRFELYRVNPPLVRMVAAVPVLAAGYESAWESFSHAPGLRTEFGMGRQFAAANGRRTLWLTTIARWACVPFSLIGALVCYLWAGDLFGRRAAVLACVLWCLSPNVLAHGALITPDAAAAALGAAACYALWKWLKKPNWPTTLISGALLGVAGLAKFTLLVFYPLWPVIWLVYCLADRKAMTLRRWGRELGLLIATLLLGLWVINLGYGLEKTFKPLGSFEFVSQSLGGERAEGLSGNRFRGTWLATLPLPLPENFLRGIDVQRYDFERGASQSFLRGESSSTGWWYYYLYGLAVKVPLGTWLLALLAAARRPTSAVTSARWADELVVLAPLVVILVLVSSQTGINQHLRYVLPVFPFAFVWISQVAQQPLQIVRVVLTAAVLWSVGSSLWVYPHSLSYFNELVGGPRGGHAHLINSNIDWGQDLLSLEQWAREHSEAKPLYLVYFGPVSHAHLGMDFDFPEFGDSAQGRPKAKLMLKPGWYAVSVNFLRGYAWNAPTCNGGRLWLPQNACVELLAREPTATAGYSIYVYHVSGDESHANADAEH